MGQEAGLGNSNQPNHRFGWQTMHNASPPPLMPQSFMLEAREAVMTGNRLPLELLNQLRGGGGVRPQNAAFVAVPAWVLYSRHTLLVAPRQRLAVMAGHMAAEVVS